MPVIVVAGLLLALLYLPLPAEMPPARPGVAAEITHVVDRSGRQIAALHGFETTVPVPPSAIPHVLRQAVVATEDKRFYSHRGIDLRATLRALRADLSRGSYVQGGSTITQQYVKTAYTDRRRTIGRKLREVALAGRLERQVGKDEILHRYLSTVYLGGGAYGVGAAAESYFRKPVSDLNLSEAALLAGLIRAPSRFDPRTDLAGAEAQRVGVLERMLAQRRITPAEHQEAVAQRLALAGPGPRPAEPSTLVQPPLGQASRYPFFVDYVRRYLVARYGPDKTYRGGLRVETALDPKAQEAAEAAVGRTLQGTEPPLEMALVSVEPGTGLVRALVGGRDFSRSQVNLALGSCAHAVSGDGLAPMCVDGGGSGRQPGSAFKPFTLARAFEKGIPPDSYYPAPAAYTYPDCTGEGCTVHNVEERRGFGEITLREATWRSVNTVYAQLIIDAGVKETAALAHRLGLTMIDPAGRLPTGAQYGPSLTLGAAEVSPLDMAAAYGVIAARGMQASPTPVVRVLDRDGRVLEDNGGRQPRRVLDEVVADNVTDVLRGAVTKGTGRRAALDRPAAGKTGTTDDYSDAWFVGYTPHLATSVWMGYTDSRSRPLVGIKGVSPVFGGTLPAQTWRDFTARALAGSPPLDFSSPAPIEPSPEARNRLRPTQEGPPETVPPVVVQPNWPGVPQFPFTPPTFWVPPFSSPYGDSWSPFGNRGPAGPYWPPYG